MKHLFALAVLVAGSALGQSVDVYGTILSSHLRQLLTEPRPAEATPAELFASDILRVAKPNGYYPSRLTAVRFSTALLGVLGGVEPSRLRTETLAACIVAAIYSPESSYSRNEAAFQKELVSQGVTAAASGSVVTLLRALSVEAHQVRAVPTSR